MLSKEKIALSSSRKRDKFVGHEITTVCTRIPFCSLFFRLTATRHFTSFLYHSSNASLDSLRGGVLGAGGVYWHNPGADVRLGERDWSEPGVRCGPVRFEERGEGRDVRFAQSGLITRVGPLHQHGNAVRDARQPHDADLVHEGVPESGPH